MRERAGAVLDRESRPPITRIVAEMRRATVSGAPTYSDPISASCSNARIVVGGTHARRQCDSKLSRTFIPGRRIPEIRNILRQSDAPGKRPFHTINPMMVLHPDGSPYMVLGSPGGDGRPQTVVPVLNNMLLFGMQPQAAVEVPRLQANGLRASVETGMLADSRSALRARGPTVRAQPSSAAFGGASVIVLHPVSKARMVGRIVAAKPGESRDRRTHRARGWVVLSRSSRTSPGQPADHECEAG